MPPAAWLWNGDFVTHHGRHVTVEQAQVYARPSSPPKAYVSAFGPKAVEVAARIGDGYVSTMPDADLVRPVPRLGWRRQAGAGRLQGLLGTAEGGRWPLIPTGQIFQAVDGVYAGPAGG